MNPQSERPRLFRDSLKALRSTRTLATCAMLLALQVLLDYAGSFTLTPAIRISFGFLAVAMTAHLFGPVPAMANAALSDLIVFLLKPMGAYHPGFTLSAALGGLVYGVCFYRREITVVRVALAKLAVDVFINLALNTLWLYQLQGKAFMVLLPPRAIKNMLQLPVDVLLLMVVLKAVGRVLRGMGYAVSAPAPRPARAGRGRRLAIALICVVWIVAGVWLNNTSLLVDNGGAGYKLLAHRGLAQTFDVKASEWDTNTAEIIHEPAHDYLENTLRSMQEAFRLGTAMVELDVRRTKDDRLAVFHDFLVDYRTDGHGLVSELTMDELKRLDVGYGYTADGGATHPFRGQGVGLMPELHEVFAAFPDKDLLIHVKDEDERLAELLADILESMDPERLSRIQCYGDDAAMRALEARLPGLRVMSMESLKRGIIEYIALGWSGYIPESLKHTELHLPVEYARFLWGWPKKFMQRMDSVDTRVVLVKGAGGASEGFDDLESLREIPDGYTGYVWTNRIDVLAGAE